MRRLGDGEGHHHIDGCCEAGVGGVSLCVQSLPSYVDTSQTGLGPAGTVSF